MACELDYSKERHWEGDYLKEKCVEVGVEDEYNLYQVRIRIYYLGVFLFLHWIVITMHSVVLLATSEHKYLIYVDVIFYFLSAILITVLMCFNLKEEVLINHNWVMYVTSVTVVLTLVAVDLSLNVYHYHKNHWITGSFYDTYIILMIYMFLPIPKILAPLALGIVVSCIYILYYIYYVASKYRFEISNANHVSQMVADISHHICLHFLGVFFRVLREIVVRSSFLDRHQFVMEDIWLRNARAQEKIFLHSILPQQIAQPIQDDIRNRIAIAEKHRSVPIDIGERIMSIQNHPDVTILYADIVNYTHLTTTLSVKSLVTLLHNLYARFDKAASHFNVQRIKFLGDCYYCVSGLITPDPDHPKWCMELGLCMIKQIREVRDNQNVEIDIRVGVHSGALFAGVLGAAKLQYDIWGTDVVIANRLEATGVPGHIHISDRTLQSMVDNPYTILPGTEGARNDPYLNKFNITTFLIAASESPDVLSYDDSSDGFESRSFTMSMQLSARSELNESRVSLELRNEFKKMPVGPSSIRDRFKYCFSSSEKKAATKHEKGEKAALRFFFLDFPDPRLEYEFMRQPDYLLKYSILLVWLMSLCLIIIDMVFRQNSLHKCYYIGIAIMLSLSILLFITWYKKLCFCRFSEGHRYSTVSCVLFRIAENLQSSLVKRVCVYMYTITAYFLIFFNMLSECELDRYILLHIESKLYHYEPDSNMCFQPWVLTNMLCLIIGMSLIFTRIPFILKIVVISLEILTYLLVVFFQYQYIVHNSLTTNPFFVSEYAHCILVLITTLSLYLMERQTEFNNKINFKWRVELRKKQRDARLADQSITILLHNILPSHVVDIYLTSLARHELYYEDYEMVAVMFATLKNFELEMPSLRVLNEIITEFDRILSYYKDEYSVEKIKIVGCTYMAACGLDIRLSSIVSGRQSRAESIVLEVMRAQRSLNSFNSHYKQVKKKNEDVVFVLTAFALDLMRTLFLCNAAYKNVPSDREMFKAEMRIGISSGEVMAGVVGASQVHYDIWGNAVNMASRMDSTGVIGKIQVTDETASILRKCGIKCHYRGMTFVKGRGILPTYFVGIDENYSFQYLNEAWTTGHSDKSSSTEISYAE